MALPSWLTSDPMCTDQDTPNAVVGPLIEPRRQRRQARNPGAGMSYYSDVETMAPRIARRRQVLMQVRKACIAVLAAVVAVGCSRETPDEEAPVPNPVTDSAAAIWRVQEFRRLVHAKQTEVVRAFVSSDPRRWYEERQGPGEPWDIASAGPWAAWDEHFHSRSEDVSWSGDIHVVTLRVREMNDYYKLLDRGPQMTELVYSLDSNGRIDGLLIRAAGERVPGRTDEFLAWARREAPLEIEYLMPGGKIDPTGDRAPRFRVLLQRWRAAAGLPKID